jgi:hypothetical protein
MAGTAMAGVAVLMATQLASRITGFGLPALVRRRIVGVCIDLTAGCRGRPHGRSCPAPTSWPTTATPSPTVPGPRSTPARRRLKLGRHLLP